MKPLLPLFLSLIILPRLNAQMNTTQNYIALSERFRLKAVTSRRFTQDQMLEWIQPLEKKGVFSASVIGSSAEGRALRLYTLGGGPTKVLLWSQMHGDESTATMALLDLMNFFSGDPDNSLARTVRENLTLLVIPMLNPDGAERFQRRTAQSIDMNRDALRLVTPEARILKEIRDQYNPEFGFNLHDQDPRYTVGQTKTVSAIALLAPAIDEAKSENPSRLRARQVASRMAETLQQLLPGHLTRYDDTFEPRAFGDNIQRWGTSTILIESGGWPGDPEKMHLRKANFVALLAAFHSIATGDYSEADLSRYETLPMNGKNLYDMILRRATFRASSAAPPVVADIGINFEEKRDSLGIFVSMAKVVDVGDLSTMAAFQEFDFTGIEFHSTEIDLEQMMTRADLLELLKRKQNP